MGTLKESDFEENMIFETIRSPDGSAFRKQTQKSECIQILNFKFWISMHFSATAKQIN